MTLTSRSRGLVLQWVRQNGMAERDVSAEHEMRELLKLSSESMPVAGAVRPGPLSHYCLCGEMLSGGRVCARAWSFSPAALHYRNGLVSADRLSFRPAS